MVRAGAWTERRSAKTAQRGESRPEVQRAAGHHRWEGRGEKAGQVAGGQLPDVFVHHSQKLDFTK